ncbi:MAG: NAD(P)/FAD-dependent oxidoreductase [Burkholderiales bacterium]|nr:NAD(P)/FAD-dependent oxidoreductase [Burkholderiales bacterium]
MRVDRDVLRAALAQADLRVLVMCLYHLTGDEKWLEPPYRPARDVRLIGDPAAGFGEDTQRTIRQAMERLLADGAPRPAVDAPDEALFQRMMSVCLGETVPAEYVPMMRQDMGFEEGDVRWTQGRPETLALDVVIAGAGVSGLCLAARLEALGIAVTVLEKNPEVGGTWFDNRYPGCGVDTPNHFYSYACAPNPDWSRYFSLRDEIQAYLEGFAQRRGLRRRIRFGCTLTAARWDEAARRWRLGVRSADGAEHALSAAVLVCATGHFSEPHEAPFPGAADFAGEMFHTARWPANARLEGRRVGVIGTGASAMQAVPTIAGKVAALTIFQRTAQWARPVAEYRQSVDPAARLLFSTVPYYARWYRFTEFWRYGDGLLRTLRKDPAWTDPQRSLNRTNDRHRAEMTEYIRAQLARRPELVERCVPSYPPFGKRILIDNGWFETLCRPHVALVTDAIERIERDGVRTADGRRHALDVLVLATGFRIANLPEQVDIHGRGGARLADDWADDNPSAYLGITVPGFPNLFVMYGPNTNMGHGGSVMWLAETQSRYICGCLVAMAERGVAALEAREERRAAYTREIDDLHAQLVWTHPGMTTYYRNRHGKVRSPMPFRLVDYWTRTRRPRLDDFLLTR